METNFGNNPNINISTKNMHIELESTQNKWIRKTERAQQDKRYQKKKAEAKT